MLYGHGDDLARYESIEVNFSSNVYGHLSHQGLYTYLAEQLPHIAHYPAPTPQSLEEQLAVYLRLDVDEVLVTNGATEAIYLLAQAYRGLHSAVLQPTFAEYVDACEMYDHKVRALLSLDAIDERDQMVWLCCPNNPTGTVIPADTLRTVMDAYPNKIFVIDASYAAFTQEEMLSLRELVNRRNVYVLHSMTKRFGVPGLRLGALLGYRKQIDRVACLRMPWSVSELTQRAGLYLLAHANEYILPLDMLLAERKRVASAFEEMGLRTHPSDTHILLAHFEGTLPDGTQGAAALKDWLAVHDHLLIRDASNFYGLDANAFRIAVQLPEENDRLIQAIRILLLRG